MRAKLLLLLGRGVWRWKGGDLREKETGPEIKPGYDDLAIVAWMAFVVAWNS
jgi:hypothetical protein